MLVIESEALPKNILAPHTLNDGGIWALYRPVAGSKENSEIRLIGRGRKVTFQVSL